MNNCKKIIFLILSLLIISSVCLSGCNSSTQKNSSNNNNKNNSKNNSSISASKNQKSRENSDEYIDAAGNVYVIKEDGTVSYIDKQAQGYAGEGLDYIYDSKTGTNPKLTGSILYITDVVSQSDSDIVSGYNYTLYFTDNVCTTVVCSAFYYNESDAQNRYNNVIENSAYSNASIDGAVVTYTKLNDSMFLGKLYPEAYTIARSLYPGATLTME